MIQDKSRTEKVREEANRVLDKGLAMGREVQRAGRQVWLAGLGTVATVEESGRSLFSNLVQAGEKLENRTRDRVGQPLEQAGDRLRSLGQDLEEQVEERVTATVQRFGIPSRQEVQELITRVETLTEKVEGLSA